METKNLSNELISQIDTYAYKQLINSYEKSRYHKQLLFLHFPHIFLKQTKNIFTIY